MKSREIRDQRAPAFPDEPFSAYCKVCWQNIYCLWIDKNDHHEGKCLHGAERMQDCQQAMEWETAMAKIRQAIEINKPE